MCFVGSWRPSLRGSFFTSLLGKVFGRSSFFSLEIEGCGLSAGFRTLVLSSFLGAAGACLPLFCVGLVDSSFFSLGAVGLAFSAGSKALVLSFSLDKGSRGLSLFGKYFAGFSFRCTEEEGLHKSARCIIRVLYELEGPAAPSDFFFSASFALSFLTLEPEGCLFIGAMLNRM